MITRPLDLGSKLRAAPATFEWLFFVNGGLIVLFFYLFASQFVLAPSLGVQFRPPEMAGAEANAESASHHVRVTDAGQIFAGDGSLSLEQFQKWLHAQMVEWRGAKRADPPVLLIQHGANVSAEIWMRIVGLAQSEGFKVTVWAEEKHKSRAVDTAGGTSRTP
jgi:biopolymer transport protein ExbD